MGMQIAGLGTLVPAAPNLGASAAPTPAAFAALTAEQQVSYVESVSTDVPPFALLGDPSATPAVPQVLAIVSPDGKSVVTSDVPSTYSAALASGTDPSANDFRSWVPSLQLNYLRLAGGSTQSATLVSGTLSLTAAVDATGKGVNVVQQTAGPTSFWSSSTAAFTAASAAATAAAGQQPTGAAQSVTSGVLSSAGAADTTVPYLAMPGATYGLSSPVNSTVAGILFPLLNGDPTQAGSSILPTNPKTAADQLLVQQFNTRPDQLDANTFGSWNSAVQLQYLRANDPMNHGLAIGIPNSADGVLHAFMSTPKVPQSLPQKVYVVENIQKQDISTMALADQQKLAGLASFQTVAQSLGLIPDGIDSSTPGGIHAKDSAQASVIIQGQFTTAFNTIADPSKGVPSLPNTPGAMPDADAQVFKDELTLIQSQAAGSAIFSPKDIQDKINAVITRFQRAYAFGSAANTQSYGYKIYAVLADQNGSGGGYLTGSEIDGYQQYFGKEADGTYFENYNKPTYNSVTKQPVFPDPNVIAGYDTNNLAGTNPPCIRVYFWNDSTHGDLRPSKTRGDTTAKISYVDLQLGQQFSNTDGNVGITSGYNVFMTQERAILAQSSRAQALASNASGTQNLDVPNIVYLFQLYTNLIGEAALRADTEQVNQTNAQLQTYAVMQRIINQTVAHIGSSTDGSALYGSADTAGNFTPEEQRALDIFNSLTGVPPQSPVELLQGIHRPITDTSTSASKTGPSWSQFGTELSDTVTLLNQNSQLKMNDINAETKQKDRNFDLANTALSKMNDVLSKIAASIG